MGVKEGLLTLFLGAPGQLYTRIEDLNGSLDKPWLLLFFVPPLSIVSSIWFFLDWVEKGQGGDPVDEFLFILPFSSIIFSYIFYNLCDTSDFISTPLILIFNIMTFAAARIIRKSKDCPNKDNLSYGRAFHTGIMASTTAMLANLSTTFLSFIPFIGIAFSLWGFLGYIPGLDVGLLCAIINIFLNMELNTFNTKKDEFCNQDKKIFSLDTLWRISLAIFLSIAISFIPF